MRRLLDRCNCPVAFHEVRTRFLGNIASPILVASPLDQVKALWGGELPEFESMDAANELIGALAIGLWNRLTRHQDRRHPFRLTRFEVPASREGLERICRVRREEIDRFVEGLFGSAESIDLPETAHRALNTLSEMRAILEGAQTLAADETKPASAEDITGTLRNMRELTRIAERFDVSREAAARRYVTLHRECLAAVFSRHGRVRYVEKGQGFPKTSVWAEDPLPSGVAGRDGAGPTSLDEADPAAWLAWPDSHAVFAQTLFQNAGFAITLLVAERSDDGVESPWEPPRFRR